MAKASRTEYRKAAAGAGPELAQGGLKYELSDKVQGTTHGGASLMVALAQKLGLTEAIDRRLNLVKFHLPYHESDHVMNLAINALCGGTCLEDMKIRRNDENFLNAVGADAIPAPTMAGDFCRRFGVEDVDDLHRAIDDARIKPGQPMDESFFKESIIKIDGTQVGTTGQTKGGVNTSYKGIWCYHPLLVRGAHKGRGAYKDRRFTPKFQDGGTQKVLPAISDSTICSR